MNTRTTLFLVTLVALVGGFVLWDHYKGTTTEQHETKSKRIFDFEAKNITGIDLVRSNQTIDLEKSGDNWDIKQPLAVRADPGAVNSILDELEFAERTRTVTESELQGVSLSDFGLDAPRFRVTLHSQKRPVGLIVGRETPTKDAVYVQVEGRKEVYVARKSVEERLNLSLDSLRSRIAIDFTPASATRVEIKTADRVIELSKSAAGWSLTRPLVARADQNKVNELLTDLSSLRVQDFVSEEPKDVHVYQLDDPEREVSVFTGEAGKTLVLGKPLTNDAAKVDAKLKTGNSIFTVSGDVTKKFAIQINDLRDTRVLAFHKNNVHGIEIIHGPNKIVLNRTDKGWQLTAPVTLPADDPAVEHFLDDLGILRATQFVADVATDLDRYGLATPATTVSLLGAGTNVVTQLLLGGVDASNTVQYAKTTGEPFIYAIAPGTDHIPGNYAAFRTHRIFDLKPHQVTKLIAGAVTLTRDAQGKWKLVAPAQGALDLDSVQHLLEAFCQLRAEEFGRAKTDQDATLGTTIKVTVGEATHWLAVAKSGEAAADVCDFTFQLAPPVVQTLTKELSATVVSTNPPATPPASTP